MTDLRTAAQQALEALLTYEQYIQPLTNVFGGPRVPEEGSASAKVDAAITALRAALAEPVQERNFCPRCGKRTNDIHTCTPPDSKHATIKQHKPLTTEEVEQLWAQSSWQGRANIGFARAIERAHGIGV